MAQSCIFYSASLISDIAHSIVRRHFQQITMFNKSVAIVLFRYSIFLPVAYIYIYIYVTHTFKWITLSNTERTGAVKCSVTGIDTDQPWTDFRRSVEKKWYLVFISVCLCPIFSGVALYPSLLSLSTGIFLLLKSGVLCIVVEVCSLRLRMIVFLWNFTISKN